MCVHVCVNKQVSTLHGSSTAINVSVRAIKRQCEALYPS